MTNPNQLCDVLLFVCSKMADETTLALNCLLQIEQERSEEESSVGDALALAFRYKRFRSASQILFASHWPTPLLMRPRHFVRSKQTTYIKHIPYNIAYALRENSYQPAPPHSLIRGFAGPSVCSQWSKASSGWEQSLWPDCAEADEVYLRWVHMQSCRECCSPAQIQMFRNIT